MRLPLLNHPWLRSAAKHRFGTLLMPLVSQQPAAKLIRRTAREQWKLLALNIGSSLVEALTEGATLAVIFLAVESLSAASGAPPKLATLPLLGGWLSGLNGATVFLVLLGAAVLLQALQSLMRFCNQLSVGYFAARCTAKVTALIHHQVLSFTFPCASGYKVGDLTNYAQAGPLVVRREIETVGTLTVGVLMIATYLGILVRISPWLLIAVVVLGGLISVLQKELLPRIRMASRSVTQSQVEISSRVTEDIQGLRLLHSTGQLAQADRLLQQRMGVLEQGLRRQSRLLAVLSPISTFLPVLAIALIASLSLLLFQSRSSGVLANLVTFVLAVQRLNQRLSIVANTFNTLAENESQIERLNEILSPYGKEFRTTGGLQFNELQRGIRFEEVDLRYTPDLPNALSKISFKLMKGSMLALVGPSGAGKSSIADLLVGLYSPTSGNILVDDRPLAELDLASWQQHLGVVSQDTFLFNATLAENIAFGTPGATIAQIQQAAAAAQADGFIQSLPQGYDTMVGERGYRLSGGQRQRISLARAILRSPELLILDEATSALDSQSEQLVQEALKRFERNHTVLVIAHRLSTIVEAHQILVLEDGRIVESGNHQTLLAKGGLYSNLWQQQSKSLSATGTT